MTRPFFHRRPKLAYFGPVTQDHCNRILRARNINRLRRFYRKWDALGLPRVGV